jgi:C-terminal processing protease CtpA/Prc
MGMPEQTNEEKFILEKLHEEGGRIGYKRLQQLCEDEFEGVRLVLKKLKEKGLVDYEGVIPGFSAEITLLKEE